MKRIALIASFFLLIMVSCRVSQKDIQNIDSNNEVLISRTDKLIDDVEVKSKEGKMNKRTTEAIGTKISENRLRSFDRRADVIKANKYTRNAVTRLVYNRNLQFIQNRFAIHVPQMSKDSKQLDVMEETVVMAEAFDVKTNAFFAPGKYRIPDQAMVEAVLAFSPILDSIISFSEKFPDQKLNTEIGVFGYTDGTGEERSNEKLSSLRASEVARVVYRIIEVKKSSLPNPENVSFYVHTEGRGEELPNPKNTYTEDDERRRVVKIFWNILPE